MSLDLGLPVLLLLEGALFIAIFTGLALYRKDQPSLQFIVESAVIAAGAAGLVAYAGTYIHPIVLLVILYLVTLRTRLLVDMGNQLAQRGQYERAHIAYGFALRLLPDEKGRTIALINQAVALLQQGMLDDAITRLKAVLGQARPGTLDHKYAAVSHFNLGVAYNEKGQRDLAERELKAVLEVWPGSEYAKSAQAMLEQIEGTGGAEI